MLELKLKGYTRKLDNSLKYGKSFQKPIIFYLVNQEDTRTFFISFCIVDFVKNEILYLFSYDEENITIVNGLPDQEKYVMEKTPHMTLSVNDGEDFLTFIDEEEFFLYVNYKKMVMKVITGNDLVKDSEANFKKFCSTVYKDQNNKDSFFTAMADEQEMMHIFKVSLDLKYVEEIDKFPGNEIPPHVIRNCKDYLLLSHVFEYPKYLLSQKNKVVDKDEIAALILKNAIKIMIKSPNGSNLEYKYSSLTAKQKVELLYLLKDTYKIENLPGEIILFHLQSKEKLSIETSGGMPSHFELDPLTDTVYTSSHNFIIAQGAQIFYAPAVLDKFRLRDGQLKPEGSFQDPCGYRYTSHRLFYYRDKPYLCTFGQPSRLMIIDAEDMSLIYYEDIENDGLLNAEDPFSYVNTEADSFEIAAIEVSKDGEYLLFIGPEYIYIYDFTEKTICEKIRYIDSYTDIQQLNRYKLKTLHINYLE